MRADGGGADFVAGGVVVQAVVKEQIFARLSIGPQELVPEVDVVEIVLFACDVVLDQPVGLLFACRPGSNGSGLGEIEGYAIRVSGNAARTLATNALKSAKTVCGDLPALMSFVPANSTISRGL